MDLLILSTVLGLLTLLPISASGASGTRQPGSVSPTWSRDLRADVGSTPLGQVFGRKGERRGLPETSLRFLDNSTVIAAFVTREGTNPSLSSRGGSDPNQPLRLRAIILDTHAGEIRSMQAWPTEGTLARIVTARDGKFVTQSGTTLTLYSSDCNELKNLKLPALPEDVSGWHAHPSPTGKSILFTTGGLTTTSPKPWIWVDTTSLQVLHSWNQVQSGWIGISDDSIAMTACLMVEYHCDPRLEIRSLTTEWKTIAPVEKRAHWGWSPQFVNDKTVFLSGRPWKLLQTDGEVILTESPTLRGGTALPAAGGQRFVLPFFKTVGRVEALDIGGYGELKAISIYDAPFQQRAYELEVKGAKIRSISDRSVAQLALSPDGSKLGILYNETVYLFELPPVLSAGQRDQSWSSVVGEGHIRR